MCHGVEPARLYFLQNDAPLAATVTAYLNVASITRWQHRRRAIR